MRRKKQQYTTNGERVASHRAGRTGYFIIIIIVIISQAVRACTVCYFIVYVNVAEPLILYSINENIYMRIHCIGPTLVQ